MNPNLPNPSGPTRQAFLAGLASFLFGLGLVPTSAVTPPRLLQTELVDGKVRLTWTGDSKSYQVQSTPSLTAPDWRPTLATVRTNAVLPLRGDVSFLRVVDPKPDLTTQVLTATNVTSGEVLVLTMQPQPNADLVFAGPTNWNGVDLVKMVLPASEMAKFDIAFDTEGGFKLVTEGEPTAYGGWMTTTVGPGANELTYSGFLTNGPSVVTFSAVTDPEPAEGVIGGLIGALVWWYCQPGFTAKALQCQAAAAGLIFPCALQFKVPYANLVTEVDGSGLLTNRIDCISRCETGCK